MKTYTKLLQILTLVLFLGLSVLPVANHYLHLVGEAKDSENRAKAPEPVWNGDADVYAKAWDSYYTDHFSLRNNYIGFLNRFEFSLFGTSPVPLEVVVGKDGWFYPKNAATNYKGNNLFNAAEMARYRNELRTRTAWALKRGMRYYTVLVPTKMEIYPEYLPRQVIKLSDSTRYDQVLALNGDSGICVIGLKEILLKHKHEGHDLYQHTDDHWNELGAYYGYQTILNRLSVDYPELKPWPLNNYSIGTEEREGNMAAMIHEEKEFPEHFVKLVPKVERFAQDGVKRGYPVPKRISEWDYEIVKVNTHGTTLKCLVIRDSFTLLMIPYLQEHFRESVFIHSEWEYQMHEDLILKEKPDIILNIMIETEIHKPLEFPFVPKAM